MNGCHKDTYHMRAVTTSMTGISTTLNPYQALNGSECACMHMRVPSSWRRTTPTEITMQGNATHDYCAQDPNTLPPLSKGVGRVPSGHL
jgi:hypothetical protein